MRATTTIIVIAGCASTAFGAATKMFSDENCGTEVDKKVFNGFSTGDAPIPSDIKSIRTDSFSDTWFAYQDSEGPNCKGDLIMRVKNDECIKTADLGIGCTRLCSGGLGGGDCASAQA
ncbi:hypothetical protein QC761_0076030 [Podospora bellae-mahoneyi]|uniref:Ecp2 effector protein domain-containing protein n=1 Tax=Podospora bellae-mahoneyi TaxID=2093777 RepID=A0ABR0FCD3_9PEZI|nr:hypothetical protein QC761_0076030 [Podospora bellae-mahoneyi]